jgi:hypothetical protein
VKSTLSYGTRPDWGIKSLPPAYTRIYEVLIVALICGYLWKFHLHHASLFFQASMIVLVIGLLALLALRWKKNDRMPQFLWWLMLIQIVAQSIALIHSF